MFSLLDLILILSVFGFTLFGLWFGLIHTFGAFVGTIVGVFVAGKFYTLAPAPLFQVGLFIMIFLAVSRLFGFGFSFLERVFDIVSLLPFLRSINRLGGVVFGFLEGVLFIGAVLIVASHYDLGAWFTNAMTQSNVAPSLVNAAQVLLPFLPVALQRIQSYIPWVTR